MKSGMIRHHATTLLRRIIRCLIKERAVSDGLLWQP